MQNTLVSPNHRRKMADDKPQIVFVVSTKHRAIRPLTWGHGRESRWLEWDEYEKRPVLTRAARHRGMFTLESAFEEISAKDIKADPGLKRVKEEGFEVYKKWHAQASQGRVEREHGTTEREGGRDSTHPNAKHRWYPKPFDHNWLPPRVVQVLTGKAPEQQRHKVPDAPERVPIE